MGAFVRRRFAVLITVGVAVVVLVMATVIVGLARPPAVDANDEILTNFGDTPTSMVLHWRGPDSTVAYGTDSSYGKTATARPPAITPVDTTGPFWQVTLDGLTPGTVYHYRIGNGADHTFKTAPTGDFRWVDIADAGTTFKDPAAGAKCATPWIGDHWKQIAAEKPDFVTFGGDTSYANKCGVGAVHQFFNDVKPVSTIAAMMFAWGNHEYGGVTSPPAPPGTPRDRLSNYKSRITMPNAQTLANDTPTRLDRPGCPAVAPATTNSCQGNDWGWFDAGGIRFILWPEVGIWGCDGGREVQERPDHASRPEGPEHPDDRDHRPPSGGEQHRRRGPVAGRADQRGGRPAHQVRQAAAVHRAPPARCGGDDTEERSDLPGQRRRRRRGGALPHQAVGIREGRLPLPHLPPVAPARHGQRQHHEAGVHLRSGLRVQPDEGRVQAGGRALHRQPRPAAEGVAVRVSGSFGLV
ncbi:hypothetical protein BKD30_06365 [Tersicoccus phoenicis]|uniref:Purple acid phosphatase N-terminal domain-containing protein n=1 Tax=Tersicoccus phoenicis TaxID=554083 RepID=A0A1R1LCC7_9MICC|nr:hypothetical protein BKD30_06365 [Tersicoccus phoenicis]